MRDRVLELRGRSARLGARVRDVLPEPVRRSAANPWVNGLVVAVVALVLVLAWGGVSYSSYVLLLLAVYAIAVLGLNIPAGFGGALSLGQGAAFAVGAYLVGVLSANLGWVLWWTLPITLVGGFVLGLLIGAPAGRLGVIGLAMVSLGLTLVTTDLILHLDPITGGAAGISGIVPILVPGGDPVDTQLLLPVVIIGAAFLTYVAHHHLRHTRFGRASLAVRDGEPGAVALGISPYRTRVLGFALGSAFGALAGGLFAYLSLYLAPDSLTPQLSIMLLVMVILGGAGSVHGPLIGAAVLTVVPLWLTGFPGVNNYLYGGLLVALMLLRPDGLLSRTSAAAPDPFAGASDGAAAPSPDRGAPLLDARGLRKSFGGVHAVDGVDVEVRRGHVLGLVGPNGSGKTTLLNLLSGLYPADGGSVVLAGEDLVGMRPHEIARRGVGRTFQTPKTFAGLGVGEHFALRAPDGVRPEVAASARAMAREVLRTGGIDPDDAAALAAPAGRLSHGQLRFLEIAVAVHACPRLLLLDEPAAGLAAVEIDRLVAGVRAVADSGVGVIVVEHHLDFIRRLVDEVVVLDLGTVLWRGAPDELAGATAVQHAYLGKS